MGWTRLYPEGHAGAGGAWACSEDSIKIYSTENVKYAENAKHKAKVTDTIDDKRLNRCCPGFRLVIPKANQQI